MNQYFHSSSGFYAFSFFPLVRFFMLPPALRDLIMSFQYLETSLWPKFSNSGCVRVTWWACSNRSLCPSPWVSDLVDLGWGWRMCISDRLPGDTDADVLGAASGAPLSFGKKSQLLRAFKTLSQGLPLFTHSITICHLLSHTHSPSCPELSIPEHGRHCMIVILFLHVLPGDSWKLFGSFKILLRFSPINKYFSQKYFFYLSFPKR